MSTLATCSQCGDLYSSEASQCPTCGTRRSGAEQLTASNPSAPAEPRRVVVTDFAMPFESMVTFMVKWAIAAIPAVIILFIIFAILGAVMGGFFASLIRQ